MHDFDTRTDYSMWVRCLFYLFIFAMLSTILMCFVLNFFVRPPLSIARHNASNALNFIINSILLCSKQSANVFRIHVNFQ